MNLGELKPPQDLPVSARVPGFAPRVALAIVAALLSLLVYATSGWLALGVVLGLLAAWKPQSLLGWVVILFLGVGELSRPGTLTWQLLVLLAGVHLIHVLGMLTLQLPWRSWVQAAVFIRPLRRFIGIQIPVQLLGVVALLLLAPNAHGHRPVTVVEFAILGAASLAGLALLLIRMGQAQSAAP